MVGAELLPRMLRALERFFVSAGFGIADGVAQQTAKKLRAVFRLRETAGQLGRSLERQMLVVGNRLDFLFGQVAVVDAVLDGNHRSLSSLSDHGQVTAEDRIPSCSVAIWFVNNLLIFQYKIFFSHGVMGQTFQLEQSLGVNPMIPACGRRHFKDSFSCSTFNCFVPN
jgi:hypothetical protein